MEQDKLLRKQNASTFFSSSAVTNGDPLQAYAAIPSYAGIGKIQPYVTFAFNFVQFIEVRFIALVHFNKNNGICFSLSSRMVSLSLLNSDQECPSHTLFYLEQRKEKA